MIQIDDSMNATPIIEQHMKEAIKLLETVAMETNQETVLAFIKHMRDISLRVDETMSKAVKNLEKTGKLDDEMFAEVCAVGSSHGAMLMFCRSFEDNPSEYVRLACASGEIALRQLNASPDYIRVVEAAQKRLQNMT